MEKRLKASTINFSQKSVGITFGDKKLGKTNQQVVDVEEFEKKFKPIDVIHFENDNLVCRRKRVA